MLELISQPTRHVRPTHPALWIMRALVATFLCALRAQGRVQMFSQRARGKKQNIESSYDILIRGSQGSIKINSFRLLLVIAANLGRDAERCPFETAENKTTTVDESEIAAGGMTNDSDLYLWLFEHQQCFEPVRWLQPPKSEVTRSMKALPNKQVSKSQIDSR